MEFIEGLINDVIFKNPAVNSDKRGWLFEVFRSDDCQRVYHAMAYLSGTNPLTTRGPHMHQYQTDYFVFLGIGQFRLYLWDNRPASSTYRHKQVFDCSRPTVMIVPPGVVHAYKNHSEKEIGVVLNMPDRLYAGLLKSEAVDEVRFENDSESPFKIEDFPDFRTPSAI